MGIPDAILLKLIDYVWDLLCTAIKIGTMFFVVFFFFFFFFSDTWISKSKDDTLITYTNHFNYMYVLKKVVA